MDAEVSEENTASVFRVEVCRFGSSLSCIVKLRTKWPWGPRRGGKGRNPIRANGKKRKRNSAHKGHRL
jgi:hypothetical protein